MKSLALILACMACQVLAYSIQPQKKEPVDERKAVSALLLAVSAGTSSVPTLGFNRNPYRDVSINAGKAVRRRAFVFACADEMGLSEADLIRLARVRLCEEHYQRVLKRKPRFLPFISARQWARAMPLDTEEEWMEWLSNGEKRNSYIPSRPDEVYADSGWQGWHDFLNGPIEPASVVLKKGYRRGKWLQGPRREDK